MTQRVKHITRIAYKQPPEKGDPGVPGARGPIRRITEWAGQVRYYAGNAGEEYQDIVYYNKLYYLCKITHTSIESQTPYFHITGPNGDSGFWELLSDFKVIASKVVFVGSGTQGWIIDEGRIYHSSGKIELAADGSFRTSNGNYVVDADGNLTAQSGIFAGFLVAKFARLNGNVTLSTQTNVLGGGYLTLTLPTDASFAGRRLFVVDTNFPPYTKTSLGMYTDITVANGHLYGLGEYSGENTPAYSHISVRGGCVELVAVPTWDASSVMWIVSAGHENIISKY